MYWFHIILLSIIQGITEFLPISSSAHLILLPIFLSVKDQGLVVDLFAHLGSLVAIILFFQEETKGLLIGMSDSICLKATANAHVFKLIVVATLPIIVVGLLISDFVSLSLRNAGVIAVTTVIGALLLWISDRKEVKIPNFERLGIREAFYIGLFQVLALLPGTSRSGITMTAGRFLKLDRSEAARFSLLLSVPTTSAAISLISIKVFFLRDEYMPIDWQLLMIVAMLSGLSAYGCLTFLMRFLKFSTFLPFVVYRFILGISIILWLCK